MKKFKRIAAMAASMLILTSGMTALSSNASLMKSDTPFHLDEIENENYVIRPDLYGYLETIAFPYPGQELVNVLISKGCFEDYSYAVNFTPEIRHYDKAYVNLDISDMENATFETIEQEIRDNMNLSDKDDISIRYSKNYYENEKGEVVEETDFTKFSIDVYYQNNNHDENYLKANELTSFFKENYGESNVLRSVFQKGYYQKIAYVNIYPTLYYTNNITAELADEINTIAERDNLKFKIVEIERESCPYDIRFDDDATLEEALKGMAFLRENYDIIMSMMYTANGVLTESIDLLNIIAGDANEDGEVNISDAVLIMQSIANPEEFELTLQGKANADIYGDGDGVTLMDALTIQEMSLNKSNA